MKIVVVIQFLSGVDPLAEMPEFTPFLLQLLPLRFDSGHFPFSNQSSMSPLSLAFSKSSSVRALPVLKNSDAVYPACRKRRLLGIYQLQSDC